MKKRVAERNGSPKNSVLGSAKECAYIAVFTALIIALQVALSAVPGVELVTVSFVAYAFIMGPVRGMVAATAFSLMRQLVFGVDLKVLVLYLVYFNLLCLCFGLLGKRRKIQPSFLPVVVAAACLATAAFNLLDNALTPLWLGFSGRGWRMYFMASLPVMAWQIICTAVSVAVLFVPIAKVFSRIKKSLKRG